MQWSVYWRRARHEACTELMQLDNDRFDLSYHFEPGAENDGVTLDCPLHLLNQLDGGRLQWLVPGLLEEKILALVVSLPKSKRRALIPAAEYARAAMEALGRPGRSEERRGGEA